MKSLLGRARNFSVLPLKLDITEVLVDYNRFARAAIWQEYWHGREKDEMYKKPIFKTKKKTYQKTTQLQRDLRHSSVLYNQKSMTPGL